MNVSLTPALEKMIRKKVQSGLYNNASEVVREALRLMVEQEKGTNWLQREAALGFEGLDAGRAVDLSRAQFFKRFKKGRTVNR